jgi:hypothetical protein
MRDGLYRSGLTLAATAVITLGAATIVAAPTSAKAQIIGPGPIGPPCGNECANPPPPPSPPPPPPPPPPPVPPPAGYADAHGSAFGGVGADHSAFGDTNTFHTTGAGSSSSVSPFGFGSATANADVTSDLSVIAQTHALTSYGQFLNYTAQSSASLTYNVQVFGDSVELVPIRMIGTLSVGSSSYGYASGGNGTATWGIGNYTQVIEGNSGGTLTCGSANGVGDGVCETTFSTLFLLRSYGNGVGGQALNAFLSATANSSATEFVDIDGTEYVGNSDIKAVADPFFEIDPTWAADHPGYSLQFSDSIVNGVPGPAGDAGGVPEPAAWALMIAGFGMAGAALRRRRAAAA